MWLQWQLGMVVMLTWFGCYGNLECGCHGNLVWFSWQHELVLWCGVTTTWCYYYGNLVLCGCPGRLVWLSWYPGVVGMVTRFGTWKGDSTMNDFCIHHSEEQCGFELIVNEVHEYSNELRFSEFENGKLNWLNNQGLCLIHTGAGINGWMRSWSIAYTHTVLKLQSKNRYTTVPKLP